MAEKGPKGKVANGLLALSSAAILSVYAAGYVRTRRAAERFDIEAARRKRVPATPGAQNTSSPSPTESATSPPPAPAPPIARPKPKAATKPSRSPIAPARAAAHAPSPGVPPQSRPPEQSSAPDSLAAPISLAPTAPFAPEEPVDGDEPVTSLPAQYRDGSYLGWGTSRHGDLQAEVVIEQGRIASAKIARCLTRYPCSLLDRLLPEVVTQQGPPVTFVSGASESSDAFYDAVIQALAHAR